MTIEEASDTGYERGLKYRKRGLDPDNDEELQAEAEGSGFPNTWWEGFEEGLQAQEEEELDRQCQDCGYSMRYCCCIQFADPGGHSALRAATPNNPRIYPCPTCHGRNLLTAEDVSLGYQCDRCADRQERGGY